VRRREIPNARSGAWTSRTGSGIRSRIVSGLLPSLVPRLRTLLLPMARLGLAGAVMAALGPFGLYPVPFWTRLLFWIPAVAAVAGLILGTEALLRRHIGTGWPGPARAAAAIALAAVPAVLLIQVLLTLVIGMEAPFAPATLGARYGQILLVGLVLTGFLRVLRERRAAAAPLPADAGIPGAAAAESTAEPAIAVFLRSTAPELAGAALLALEAEDHYLRIHTDRGRAMVLMPIGRATEMLAAVPGQRVHRSYWVADAAVDAVERSGASVTLRLRGGLAVPVSKRLLPVLRQQGWLDRIAAQQPADR
jgi:hypothetical protein